MNVGTKQLTRLGPTTYLEIRHLENTGRRKISVVVIKSTLFFCHPRKFRGIKQFSSISKYTFPFIVFSWKNKIVLMIVVPKCSYHVSLNCIYFPVILFE